MGSPHFQVL